MLLRKRTFPSAEGLAAFSPSPIKLSQAFIEGGNRKVYLAGPFFTLAQLWLVEQARRNLSDLGLDVFPPTTWLDTDPQKK